MGDSRGGSGALALLAALAAGGLFLLTWPIFGMPLFIALPISLAGYGAVWLLGRGLAERIAERVNKPLDTAFIDKALAQETVQQGSLLLKTYREMLAKLPARHSLRSGFEEIADLIKAITDDVQADPKDAPQAKAFLASQGEAVLRILKLTVDLLARSPDHQIEAGISKRLTDALTRLGSMFRSHLAHLQEDNIAEMQAELDIIEQSLGFEEELQQAVKRTGRTQTG